MSKKILYFDTETTGLDPITNDIIQLAGIIVIDGKEQETFNLRVQPFNYETVQQGALDVNGISLSALKQYPEPIVSYADFVNMLGRYVDKYDKNDKFTPAGYNVRFDMDFLSNFFLKNNDNYFGSWFNWKLIDPLPLLHFLDFAGKINLPNYKLSTVCAHYNIEINAHDALGDIQATRILISHIYKNFIK